MKVLIALLVVLISSSAFAQPASWQARYDSSQYYFKIGYVSKARSVAETLEEGKDLMQVYKRNHLLGQIEASLYNDKDAIRHLKKCLDLAAQKKVKLRNTEYEELQWELFDVFLNMNDLGKADSLLTVMETSKTLSETFYLNKYELLNKLGKIDEAEEFRESDIDASSDLLAAALLIDHLLDKEDFAEAKYEIESLLEDKKRYNDYYGYFYPALLQCSENLAELKALLKKAPDQGQSNADKKIETLLIAMATGYRLNEHTFGDSLAQVIIHQSTKAFGYNNYYHFAALSGMFQQTVIRNDLVRCRGLARTLEGLLKSCIGENSVVYTTNSYYLLRYKEMLGYKAETKSTIEHYLKLIDAKAGRKFSYFTAYATWYYELDPQSPQADTYLVQANDQYTQDDQNCNGCYSLLLTALAKSKEEKADYREAEKLFRLAWEKSKNSGMNEIQYRTDLTDFYRRCHARGVRAQLEYFPELVTIHRNDSIIQSYKNLKAGMWYLSDLDKNYQDAMNESAEYKKAELAFKKTKLAWIDNNDVSVMVGFQGIFDQTVRGSELLDYMSEREKLPFYQQITDPIQAYYSFALPKSTKYQSYLIEKKYSDHIKRLQANKDVYIIKEERYRDKDYYNIKTLYAREAFNIRLATKGLLFSSNKNLHNRIIQSGDTALISLLTRTERLKKELADLYLSPREKTNDKETKIAALNERISEMEIQLGEKSAMYRNANNTRVTFEQIQTGLQPNEAVIEVIRFNHPMYYLTDQTAYRDSVYYAFLIVTPLTKDQPKVVLLKNGHDLEKKYFKYYKNMIAFQEEDTRSFDAFFSNISDWLRGYKVYFSPDGVYNLINIRSIRNPRTGKYLLEETDITILSDVKDILKRGQARLTEKPTSLIIGDPAFSIDTTSTQPAQKRAFELADLFSGGIARLAGTQIETVNINKMLRAQNWTTEMYSGANAKEEHVKSTKNPTVLHLATHGFFYNGEDNKRINPLLLSGLLFAGVEDNKLSNRDEDGILTAYEAQSLLLNNTELVVLSACETGSGIVSAGDGVYGLQRAFMTAGCSNLIMSLWSVDDQATSLLMQHFYRLWTSGQSKTSAFKNAQLEVMKKYPHPFYWGAFVMIGE